MSVLITLVDPKILKILRLLINKKGTFFHLNKISKEANVPISTTFRIVNKLSKMGLLEQTKIDKFKIYRLADNMKTKGLEVELK